VASKLKRRLGFGCGIITLLGMGFIAGGIFTLIAVGGFFNKANDWKSEESKRIVVNHFVQILKLTAEQKQQIEPIIREGLDERWKMRRDYHEKTDLMFVEDYMPRLYEFLSLEQRERLNQRLLQWRKDNKIAGAPTAIQESTPDEDVELKDDGAVSEKVPPDADDAAHQ
jgi:hypothetical protein